MQSMREKLKRKLSLHDKNPQFDDATEADDIDDETTGHLQREIEKAEADDKHPQGRPGSFLNRLISHGNKKTEDEIMQAQLAKNDAEKAARGQNQSYGQVTGTSRSSAA